VSPLLNPFPAQSPLVAPGLDDGLYFVAFYSGVVLLLVILRLILHFLFSFFTPLSLPFPLAFELVSFVTICFLRVLFPRWRLLLG